MSEEDTSSPVKKTPRFEPTTGPSWQRDGRLSNAGARSIINRQRNNNNNNQAHAHAPTAPTRRAHDDDPIVLGDSSPEELEGIYPPPNPGHVQMRSMYCGVAGGNSNVPPPSSFLAAGMSTHPTNNNNNAPLLTNNNNAPPSDDSSVEIVDNDTNSIDMSGTLFNAMVRRLNRNENSKDPTTFGSSQLVNYMENLYREKLTLLEKLEVLEEGDNGQMYRKLIQHMPPRKPKKKIDIVTAFVHVWPIIKYLLDTKLGRNGLGRDTRDGLKGFISMMQQAEQACIAEDESDRSKGVGYKSLPMPKEEVHNAYLDNGATRPPPEASCCAKCEHQYNHQPKSNSADQKHNKKLEKAWKKQNKHLEEYKKGQRPDPPVDPTTQKPLVSIAPPKLKHLVTVCKCSTIFNSLAVGGFDCPRCNDGTCEICQCACNFVCRIE